MERALTLPEANDWLSRYIDAAGEAWCRAMHRDVTWPKHGRYHCRRCGRAFHVPWEERAVWPGGRDVQVAPGREAATLFLPAR